MLRAYKYRIYPNDSQKELIEKTFGCCRLVYNLALETKKHTWDTAGISLSAFDLCKQMVDLKAEYGWLCEVDSQALQASIKNLDKAYQKFFKGAGFPKFKSKTGRQSFQCPNNKREIDWENSTLTLPKLKNIPIRLSRKFEGKIKTVTVSRTPTGKYFASILVDDGVDIPAPLPIQIEKSIGIDTGIKSFVVTSDGREFAPNRNLKGSIDRLRVLQRRASKKKKGSVNQKKVNHRVAVLHEKISNKRLNYIHKVTSELTSDNQAISTIFVEDLNVSGLLSNHKLAQTISDVSLGKFYEILRYKCKWKGINLLKIGRFDPSSKRCSSCGGIKQDLTLKDREWTCISCNSKHDRDVNAAKNILWYGVEQYLNNKTGVGSPEGPVEMSTLVESVKQENMQCKIIC